MTQDDLPTEFAPAARAPVEVIQEQADLFRQYPFLTALLDAVPDIFLIVNQQRQIVFANRAITQFLGLQNSDFINGLRVGEALSCIHAGQSTCGGCGTTEFCRTCGAVKAIITGLSGRQGLEECRITRENGDALDLRVWTTPIDMKGQTYSIFAVKDISDEKRRRALERIFFHDILNTAGVLSGFADLLDEASPQMIEEIKSQFRQLTHRLIEEINAQKALSAAESYELDVHPFPVRSLLALQEVQAYFTNHEIGRDREVVIAPESQDVWFTTDPVLLQRVLSNMLKNALEATLPGGVVTLACSANGDWVTFSAHNPTFMPRSIQLQIFKRSYSTKGTGRGLGTYSMKLLSERYLHGEVYFQTSKANGTTFFASYPLTWR